MNLPITHFNQYLRVIPAVAVEGDAWDRWDVERRAEVNRGES